MSKLPSLTGGQVVKALQKAGFVIIRQKDSHVTSEMLPVDLLLFQFTEVNRLVRAYSKKSCMTPSWKAMN